MAFRSRSTSSLDGWRAAGVESAPGLVHPIASHISASRAALSDIAEILTTKDPRDPLVYIGIGHYEHGWFLSSQLQASWILQRSERTDRDSSSPLRTGLTTEMIVRAERDLAAWLRPGEVRRVVGGPSVALQTPRGTQEESPCILSVAINQSVPFQIEATLISVALLLSRQHLTDDLSSVDRVALPELSDASDARVTKEVMDWIRSLGWLVAARKVAEKASQLRKPLRVEYRAPLLTDTEVIDRIALAKRAYNIFPVVKTAIDKIASALSQGISLGGQVSEEAFLGTNALLDVMNTKKLLAHLARDAFVCGNGILDLRRAYTLGVHLVPPEDLITATGNSVTISKADGTERTLNRVLHMRGGQQIDSQVGASVIDPFIQLAAGRDLWIGILLDSWAIRQSPRAPAEAINWANTMSAQSKQQLEKGEARAANLIGTVTKDFSDPPIDLYFPNHELLSRAAGLISHV